MAILKISLNRKNLFSANVKKRDGKWRVVGATSSSGSIDKQVAMFRAIVDHLLRNPKFRQVLKDRLG